MRRCVVYFVLSGVLFLLALLILIAMMNGEADFLILLGLVQIPLGLMQWVVGIRLYFRRKKHPVWLGERIRFYWLLTLVYFFILLILSDIHAAGSEVLQIWLFASPWVIAIYQVHLVYDLFAHYRRSFRQNSISNLNHV